MKLNIVTNNSELRSAYISWIDAVYEKDGFMTKQAVVSAQAKVDEFSNRNLDIALKVLEIASISGYRDITWAINAYNRDYRVGYTFSSKSTPQNPVFLTPEKPSVVPNVRKRLSEEVF